MKSLIDYISESQSNADIKELFEQIDERLKYREWDEVAPIIEKIFKNKWGKVIRTGGFGKAVDNDDAQNIILGYNPKGKAWIIVIYNAREQNVNGAIYNGDYVASIGLNGPMYWSIIHGMLRKDEIKLKLRFGKAFEGPARVVSLSFDKLHYDFED